MCPILDQRTELTVVGAVQNHLVPTLELMEYRVQTRTLECAFQRSLAHESELVHVRGMNVHSDESTTRGVTRHECDPGLVHRGGCLL